MTASLFLIFILVSLYLTVNAQEHKILYVDKVCTETKDNYYSFELKDTLPDGEWFVYNLKKKYGINYKDEYYKNSKYWGAVRMKGTYKNSVKNGEFIYYNNANPEGIYQIENYKNGKLDGKYIGWHSSNIKEVDGNYINGKKEGEWTYWNKEGNKEKTEYYKYDILQQWVTFYKDGQKKAEGFGNTGNTEGIITPVQRSVKKILVVRRSVSLRQF